MERIKIRFAEFLCDDRGVTVIEYGLVAGIISLTILTSVTFYGTQVSSFLMFAANGLKAP